MWKILQIIPRTGRGSFSSIFRGAQQNGENSVPQVAHVQCRQCTHESFKEEKKRHKEKEKTEEPDKNWFQEYLRQRYASSALEAVGLSTALVLGIQLSHLWILYNKNTELRHLDSDTRHRLCRLYQLAVSMPIGNSPGFGTYKNVLPFGSRSIAPPPQVPSTSTEEPKSSKAVAEFEGEKSGISAQVPLLTTRNRDFKSLLDDLVFPLSQLEFPKESGTESSVSESEESCSSTESDTSSEASSENKQPSDLPFPDFAKEWQQLIDTYYGIQGNEQGLEYARQADFSAAFDSWKSSAEKTGYARANFNVGLCYELGRGVNRNFAMACEYYSRAADGGHAKAAYNLAILQLQKKVPLPDEINDDVRPKKGKVWRDPRHLLQKAAEEGVVEAMTELGVRLLESEDNTEGARWLKMAAETQDSSSADFYLGVCYEHGIGVSTDTRQAVKHYRAACKDGHAKAAHVMGMYHEHGEGGLTPDKEAALQYYRQAAEAGYTMAERDVTRVEAHLQQNKMGTALESLLGPPPPYSSLRSHSSPSLSHYFSQRLVSCDSGFSSPENSDSFLSDLAQQMAKQRDKVEEEENVVVKANAKQREDKTMKKSQSTSSMSNIQLKLLLGETVSLQAGDTKQGDAPEKSNVNELSKKCGVGFSIGGGDGWDDSASSSEEDSTGSSIAQGQFGFNLSGQFGGEKEPDVEFGSFGSFIPALKNGGSFGQVALQKK